MNPRTWRDKKKFIGSIDRLMKVLKLAMFSPIAKWEVKNTTLSQIMHLIFCSIVTNLKEDKEALSICFVWQTKVQSKREENKVRKGLVCNN